MLKGARPTFESYIGAKCKRFGVPYKRPGEGCFLWVGVVNLLWLEMCQLALVPSRAIQFLTIHSFAFHAPHLVLMK